MADTLASGKIPSKIQQPISDKQAELKNNPTFFEKVGAAFDTVSDITNFNNRGSLLRNAQTQPGGFDKVTTKDITEAMKGLTPEEINRALSMQIDTKADLNASIQFAKNKTESDNIFYNQMSTTEQLAYGFIPSVFSYSTPFIPAAKSATYLGSAIKGGVGANIGNTVLNISSGDDAFKHSGIATLLGTSIGFGVHTFSHIGKTKEVTKALDDNNVVINTEKEALLLEKSKLEKDIADINKVTADHTSNSVAFKTIEKDIKDIVENNKAIDTETKAKVQTTLDSSIETLSKHEKDVTKEHNKVSKEKVKAETEQTTAKDKITTKLKEIEESIKVVKDAAEPIAVKVRATEEQRTKIDSITQEIKNIYESTIKPVQESLLNIVDKSPMAKVMKDEFGKTISKSQEEIRKLKAEQSSLKKEIRDTVSDAEYKQYLDATKKLEQKQKVLEDFMNETKSIVNSHSETVASHTTRQKELKDLLDVLNNTKKTIKDKAKEFSKKSDIDSNYMKNLYDNILNTKKFISKNGIERLSNEKELIKEAVQKIDSGSATLADLQKVKTQKESYLVKIAKEIDELSKAVNNMEELKKIGNRLDIPDFLQKIVFSPIANLSTSKNPFVRGIAAKLHESTIYTGLVEQHNANIVKKELDNMQRDAMFSIIDKWKKYKQDTNPSISLEDFNNLITKEAYSVIARMQKEAVRGIHGGLPAAERLELVNKRLASSSRVFSEGVNKHIASSVDEVLGYFEGVHKRASSAELASFIKSAGKGYLPRNYNYDNIVRLGTTKAEQLLFEAQYKYASLMNQVITPEVEAEFRKLAKGTIALVLDREANLGRTVQTIEKGRSATPFQQRTIQVLDDDIKAILDTNLDNIFANYKLGTHGRIALQETLGVSNVAEMEAQILSKIPNITNKEKDNLIIVAQTILGTREIDKNPFSGQSRVIKGLSTFTSATSMLGFAPATMTEISAIVGEYGFKNLMKNLVGAHVDVYNIYKNGTTADKNMLRGLGEFGEAYLGHRAVRVEAEGGIDSVGRIQTMLDKATTKGALYGGLQLTTDILRLATVSMNTDFVARMSIAKKINSSDIKKLESMGISLDKLKEVKTALKVNKDGEITNWDRASWGGIDDTVSRASMIMLDRTILHPTAATLPTFMTNYAGGGIVPRILMKFMRFPIESHERLLVRGIQEIDMNRMVGYGVNMGMWGTILMAKDALLPEEKQKYSLDDEEKLRKLFLHSAYTSSITSGAVSMFDYAYGFWSGQSMMGYKHNLSAPTTAGGNIIEGKGKVNLFLGNAQFDLNSGISMGEDGVSLDTQKIAESSAKFYNQSVMLGELTDGM